ncbi:MAG: phospholipid scramblase-related protein, partial [Bdellovibrionota bacterium]
AIIAERAGGLWSHLRRWFLRSHRPLEIDVLTGAGQKLLHFTRDFFWFFSDLDVMTGEKEKLGSIHRRFAFFYKIYDLRDTNGRDFARIESPFWRLWTFPVIGTDAVISKSWGGALREVFTDADTYCVDFGNRTWTPDERAILFAAAISIDFDYFENNQGRKGLFSNQT